MAGPYRWARHPLYTAGTTFFVSLSVLAMLLVRLPKEEGRLIERFGDEYREYMQRTGCFLPRLRRKKEEV